MQAFTKWFIDNWPLISAIIAALAPSIITLLTKNPKTSGFAPAVRYFLSRLSVFHFADVPDSTVAMKLPGKASGPNPNPKPGDPPPPIAPAAIVVFLLSSLMLQACAATGYYRCPPDVILALFADSVKGALQGSALVIKGTQTAHPSVGDILNGLEPVIDKGAVPIANDASKCIWVPPVSPVVPAPAKTALPPKRYCAKKLPSGNWAIFVACS